MMNDLISVIVPVYNVQSYLKRCLQSIQKQTYQLLEIIIIDDGSTDESGKIADEFSQKESRAFVVHKENGGLSDARNVGIDYANGKYITFIDSDDYIEEDYIEYLYELIREYGVEMATSFYRMVSNEECVNTYKDNSDKGCIIAEEAIKRMLYRDGMTHIACGKMYLKEMFERKPTIDFYKYILDKQCLNCIPVYDNKYRFPRGLLNEDLALVYYLIIESGRIAYGTKKTYYYVSNPTSITKAKVRKQDFQVFILYKLVRDIILDYYPMLFDPVLEFQETIYVKLLKRLMMNKQDEFAVEINYIRKQLKKTCIKAIKSDIRCVIKIRVFIASSSKLLFVLLCKVENVLGAKS